MTNTTNIVDISIYCNTQNYNDPNQTILAGKIFPED